MRGPLRTLLAISLATLSTLTERVAATEPSVRLASNKDRRFMSAREGVGIEAPPGWSLSQQSGYNAVLVTLVHPSGARISVAVDRTEAKDAAALADQSRPGFTAQALTIERIGPGPRGGALLDATAAKRDQRIRQLYVVRPLQSGGEGRARRQAVVVTLTAPSRDYALVSGAFDWAIAHLTLETPADADDRADGGR